MMIDTDVLIWYMRGNPKAEIIIEKLNGFFISVVTYMELVISIIINFENEAIGDH